MVYARKKEEDYPQPETWLRLDDIRGGRLLFFLMTIPPRFLDEIRSRVTLSSLVGKKVKLTRAGREFKACCPFHHEKSPSFYVNDDKQFYHCFGCQAHGDAVEFVMRHDNLSFVDAVEVLAAEAGLQMPKPDPAAVKKAEKEKDLYSLMEAATKWMQDQLYLPANREILSYVEGRGLKRETLGAFRVGFAPGDGQAMRKHLLAAGYKDEQMFEAGLLKKSEKSREPYIFFRDRVMFPVMDRRGRVIAFSGRILPDHLRPPDRGDFKPGKYINSPEGPLFDKGRTLYSEGMARQAAREGKPVIVTEGQMDVIAAAQAGFTGAVAPMGTALTEEQMVKLWSILIDEPKVPILCFDGDNAGRNAAARASERLLPLLKPNHSARFAFMPDGEDPDSLIKANGAGAFQHVLDSAISLFDFVWMLATQGKDFSVPEVRAGVVKSLEAEIGKIADREVQIHYQALMRERISEAFFKRRQPSQGGRGAMPGPALSAARPRTPVFQGIHARILLAAVLNHPHIFEQVEEAFASFDLPQPLNGLRDAVFSVLSGAQGLDREGLRGHLDDLGYGKEVDDILSESLYVHASFAAPAADPALVAGLWMELWNGLQEKATRGEIRDGWKAAFDADRLEDEERLRAIIQKS